MLYQLSYLADRRDFRVYPGSFEARNLGASRGSVSVQLSVLALELKW